MVIGLITVPDEASIDASDRVDQTHEVVDQKSSMLLSASLTGLSGGLLGMLGGRVGNAGKARNLARIPHS